MPVYKYTHECGYEHEQFLKQDKAEVLLKCGRCNRDVIARQLRDKSITYAENNHVGGILRHEKQ